jgi:hypothetical protein
MQASGSIERQYRAAVYGGRSASEATRLEMPGLSTPISPLDLVAHVIQAALTPVLLLSGIGHPA